MILKVLYFNSLALIISPVTIFISIKPLSDFGFLINCSYFRPRNDEYKTYKDNQETFRTRGGLTACYVCYANNERPSPHREGFFMLMANKEAIFFKP
ncbi:MAG TPA: hypothetical protein PKC39_01340 [Ferruginibacter sp.]|nr:hypothetical protein [Ferruginibacter sp.]HMP19577.1 hypothetical protein [Ferruginibacter sp.]